MGMAIVLQAQVGSDCWDVIGVCVERRLDLGNAILAVLGVLGLLSIYYTYRQLRLGQRAQQTQLAIQLHQDFFEDPDLRDFLYRLDYWQGERAWKFDPVSFPHSKEERSLDRLLYKLTFVGTLVHNGDLQIRDVEWLRAETAIVLENKGVLRYLAWLQSDDQIPDHSSFSGAVHLYLALAGPSGIATPQLTAYLQRARLHPAIAR
jgi:hypothetical protein